MNVGNRHLHPLDRRGCIRHRDRANAVTSALRRNFPNNCSRYDSDHFLWRSLMSARVTGPTRYSAQINHGSNLQSVPFVR